MSSEQTTSQIEVVEQLPEPTKLKIKNYKKLYHKEQERNEILEKKNKYLLAKINILTNNQNRGEKDEVLLLLNLYHLNEMNEFGKLIEIFGEEASEGISILNIDTDDEIVDINKLSKTPCSYKTDCKIRMEKTKNVYLRIHPKNTIFKGVLKISQKGGEISILRFYFWKFFIKF